MFSLLFNPFNRVFLPEQAYLLYLFTYSAHNPAHVHATVIFAVHTKFSLYHLTATVRTRSITCSLKLLVCCLSLIFIIFLLLYDQVGERFSLTRTPGILKLADNFLWMSVCNQVGARVPCSCAGHP